MRDCSIQIKIIVIRSDFPKQRNNNPITGSGSCSDLLEYAMNRHHGCSIAWFRYIRYMREDGAYTPCTRVSIYRVNHVIRECSQKCAKILQL